MKKSTTTQPAKGDPAKDVKSDPNPKTAKDASVPNKDLKQKKTLLKIEYLKRSKLCREYYEKLKSESLKSEDTEVISSGEFKINPRRWYSAWEILSVHPHKFPEFEEWLEYEVKKEEEDSDSPLWGGPVFDIKGHLSHDIEMARQDFSKKNGRDPSIDELKAHLDSTHSSPAYGNCFYLFARFKYGTRKEYERILIEVAKILESKMPKKRFREEDLRHYLKVYDLREKGMKWKDVFLEIDSDHKKEDYNDDERRKLLMDKSKAVKAIKKLEEDEYFWWS